MQGTRISTLFPCLLSHQQVLLQQKQRIILGYAACLSIWALVPSGIASILSAHHQPFTESWQLISSPCKIWDHEGSSMQRKGENSFLPSLLQSHQRILTSLNWWLCCAIYAVLLPQWQDGMCSLRPLTRAVKQTLHESNTSETWCMLMLNKLPLMIQNFTDAGKISGIHWCG